MLLLLLKLGLSLPQLHVLDFPSAQAVITKRLLEEDCSLTQAFVPINQSLAMSFKLTLGCVLQPKLFAKQQ